MGGFWSRFLETVGLGSKEVRILILGLRTGAIGGGSTNGWQLRLFRYADGFRRVLRDGDFKVQVCSCW